MFVRLLLLPNSISGTNLMIIGVTGGGTGGHVIPIKSLIHYINQNQEFKTKIEKIIWFGETNGLEHKAFSELGIQNYSTKLEFEATHSGKWRRSFSIDDISKNIQDIYHTFHGIIATYKSVKQSHIKVLFSKGGYVSLPVVISCRFHRIPIIMHESDIHAGLTSRISSLFTKNIFTGFPNTINGGACIGQIIHPELIQEQVFSNDTTTHILVNGGSSGAKSIYEFIQHIQNNSIQGVHFHVITGFRNQDHGILSNEYITIYGFCGAKEMSQLYTTCDIAITRGGVTSLFEQDLFGLKMIMLPLSITHDQELNCKYYEELGRGHITINQYKGRENNLLDVIKNNIGFKKQLITINKINKKIIYGVDQIANALIKVVNQ